MCICSNNLQIYLTQSVFSKMEESIDEKTDDWTNDMEEYGHWTT